MTGKGTTVTGVLSALAEEQQGLAALLDGARPAVAHAGRHFTTGTLHGHPVVLALCGIGKVAAATTAAALAERFGVGRIVFTGVAGGLKAGVQVGDVVVASDFVQHDMDASPLFPKHEIPLYYRSRFPADGALAAALQIAARQALLRRQELFDAATTARFGLGAGRVHSGPVASGDRFVSALAEAAELRAALPDVAAVDMESAAVAQTCWDYGMPFAAVRTISDRADDMAHVDFPAFVAAVASPYARAIIGNLFRTL